MEVEIREPQTPQDFDLIYDLRWRILRQPWGRSRETAWDEFENEAIQLMAWLGPRLIGVGRLHRIGPAEGQIRFMAVEPEYAGQGVGSQVLNRLEASARAAGIRRIVLNARDNAVLFYRRHGYGIVRPSDRLFEHIVQWQMEKNVE
jgi:ribosomal protein S18 acetylase RimI-like enzyme